MPYSVVVCFSERPGAATIVGGVVVLSGLFLLLQGRRLPKKPVA